MKMTDEEEALEILLKVKKTEVGKWFRLKPDDRDLFDRVVKKLEKRINEHKRLA